MGHYKTEEKNARNKLRREQAGESTGKYMQKAPFNKEANAELKQDLVDTARGLDKEELGGNWMDTFSSSPQGNHDVPDNTAVAQKIRRIQN